MAWHRYCDCKVWVEAIKCPGNDSSSRLFVHQDDLPAETTVYNVGGKCWVVDPSADRVCRPKHTNRIYPQYASEENTFSSCAACEEEPDEDGEPEEEVEDEDEEEEDEDEEEEEEGDGTKGKWVGAWWWGYGGLWLWRTPTWSAGSGPGQEEPTSDPPDDPTGVPASICAGHEARAAANGWQAGNIYYHAPEGVPSSFVLSVGGVCMHVPANSVVAVDPETVQWIRGGDLFETCTDCTHGHKAPLCPEDQESPDAENAPEIWIRSKDLADAPEAIHRETWCYEKPTGDAEVIPEDAFIWTPLPSSLTCETCGKGVQYQICPGHPSGGHDWWAHAKDVADLIEEGCQDTIYLRIEGRCYSLDLKATPVRVPQDAKFHTPRRVYLSCDACMCSQEKDECGQEPQERRGIQCRICAGQPEFPHTAPWVLEQDLPAGRIHMEYRGQCIFIEPKDTITRVPDDADVIPVDHIFRSCHDCVYQPRVWAPSGPPPFPPGKDKPPLPPPKKYYPLVTCDTPRQQTAYVLRPPFKGSYDGDLVGMVVELTFPGKEPECYELTSPIAKLKNKYVVNSMISSDHLFNSCDECEDKPKCVRGVCTFDADSTITGYTHHYWSKNYSDTACTVPDSLVPGYEGTVTVGTLTALWTDDDLTYCGIWQGDGTSSGGDFGAPPQSYDIQLQLKYSSDNTWQKRSRLLVNGQWSAWSAWLPVINITLPIVPTKSDCTGYSHNWDTGCHTEYGASGHQGDVCSFTVQNNPLP
jgi:hypothetical protein